MNWNSIQFKVGLLVIASLLVFTFLLFQSANWPWTHSGDVIPIRFDSVSGLRVGAMVQISGVQIGKVTDIKLLGNKVEVKTRIEDAYNVLRKGCDVNIAMVGLVGETYVNITNASSSNPLIEPDDLPLTGRSLVSTVEIMESANEALKTITKSASVLEDVDKKEIQNIVSSLKDLVNQTNALTGRTLSNLNELVGGLNETVTGYKGELGKTISELNSVIAETQTNVARISSSLDNFSQGLNNLLDENSGQVRETVANFRQISENLNTDSKKLFDDLAALKSQISELVNSTQTVVDKDAKKIDQLVDNLNRSTQEFSDLSRRLSSITDKVEKGEGTVAQLLNKSEPVEKLNKTLRTADSAINEFANLSDKIDKKADLIKAPSLQWDYELRYNNLAESLRNEIALTLGDSYRIGVSAIGEDIDYELQYKHSFGNFIARAGFVRSKPGLGFDYYFFSRRLELSLEGIGITEETPSVDLETKLGFTPNFFIIIGAHDLTGDMGYSGGIQLKY